MLRKVIIGAAVAVVLLGVVGLRYAVHRNAETALKREVARLPGIRGVTYDELTVGLSSPRLVLHQVRLELEGRTLPIAVERVSIHDYESQGRLPARFDVRMRGARMPLSSPDLGPVGRFLRELGYREILADIDLRGRYQAAGRRLEVENLRVAAPEMGRLTAKLQLNGFHPADLAPARRNILLLLNLLSQVELGGTEIEYRDAGLLARTTAPAETGGGRPDGGLLDAVAQHLEAESARQPSANVRSVLDNLAAFLRRPHHIRLRADPPQTIPLSRLAWTVDLRRLTEMLRLQVTHTPS